MLYIKTGPTNHAPLGRSKMLECVGLGYPRAPWWHLRAPKGASGLGNFSSHDLGPSWGSTSGPILAPKIEGKH